MSRLCWLAAALIMFLPAAMQAKEIDSKSVLDLSEARGEPGLVQRLEIVTLATLSLPEIERFYRQGYGLELEGPIPLQPQAMADQRLLWGVAEDFDWLEYRLSRPATWGMPRLRLLALRAPAEPVHSDWTASTVGAQGIGFAVAAADPVATRLEALGFGGSAPRAVDSLRSDGSVVAEREVVHHGPDFVRAIARERIAAEAYAPLDETSGVGGPAWLSVTSADADASLGFWTGALDLEVRSDRELRLPADGDPAGLAVRQVLLYARGSRTGAVELLIRPDAVSPEQAREAGDLPRGIVGAGFVVHDLPELLERLARAEAAVLADEVVPLPMLATRRVLSLRSPEGLIIELIEGG